MNFYRYILIFYLLFTYYLFTYNIFIFSNQSDSDLDANDSVDNEKNDPSYIHDKLEKDLKIEKMHKIVHNYNKSEPVSKWPKLTHDGDSDRKVAKLVFKLLQNVNKTPNSFELDEQSINDVNIALSRKSTRREKIEILTTVPREVSVRQMTKYFHVSYRMALNAWKLRRTVGFKTAPNKKRGRTLPNTVKKQVKDFYLCDDSSRMMPGKKDFISVKTSSGREHKQKRLLMFNIKDLHSRFREKYPSIILSRSMFTKLRPKECIVADKNGCHNVCVCKIHENVKLKYLALQSHLQKTYPRKNSRRYPSLSLSYRDALNDLMCDFPRANCHLLTCAECPGIDNYCDKIRKLLADHSMTEVKYKEWISTDR